MKRTPVRIAGVLFALVGVAAATVSMLPRQIGASRAQEHAAPVVMTPNLPPVVRPQTA